MNKSTAIREVLKDPVAGPFCWAWIFVALGIFMQSTLLFSVAGVTTILFILAVTVVLLR